MSEKVKKIVHFAYASDEHDVETPPPEGIFCVNARLFARLKNTVSKLWLENEKLQVCDRRTPENMEAVVEFVEDLRKKLAINLENRDIEEAHEWQKQFSATLEVAGK